MPLKARKAKALQKNVFMWSFVFMSLQVPSKEIALIIQIGPNIYQSTRTNVFFKSTILKMF